MKDYASCYYEPGTNRLTNIFNTGGASVAGMSYDAQGNLANKNGVVHDFDFGNRLREVVGKAGYHYDGHGRRILTWRPDDSLDFSLYGQSGQLWYQEYDAKGLAVENVYLAGSLIATYEYNWNTDVFVTKYHHTDALGSPVAVTNAAGQVTDRTDWEPYGAAIGKPAYEGIGFTGHVHDAATKLTYMQQRYYDPAIGRFLSVESAESGNSNPYNGPVDEPVVVVDGDGNAIPVGEGEQISSSPNGKYQQVKDQDGQPTGTRMDKGGHRGHADPKAQGPHAHRPGVTDETGNPHLPINPPRPREDERPEIPDPPEKPQL